MERHISKQQLDKQSSITMWVACIFFALVIGYGIYVIHITPLKNYFINRPDLEQAFDNIGKPDRDWEDSTVK